MTVSRQPATSQTGLHPRLDEIVRRRLRSSWRQPVRRHTRRAFERVREAVASAGALVLDAGCGNGESTRRLARQHPEAVVIGIDKSRHRLMRAPALPENARLVRAELADFWRLARAAGWRPARHCLFYPNPWPKPGHVARRWHAHPVFPDLLALGGRLDLRTNFELYALEFARALELAGVEPPEVVSFQADEPVSPFERKYARSGHRLFRLTVDLQRSTGP